MAMTWTLQSQFRPYIESNISGTHLQVMRVYPTPEHTGLIDYFFNIDSPVVPEDPSKFSISGYIMNASDGRGIPDWNVTVKKGCSTNNSFNE